MVVFNLIILFQVKIGSLEEQLRTRVAHMEGSLASQEEQLRESVPIELHRQQDAALELKISQAGDALRAQLFTVKERVTEMESRIAAQEGELSTVAASFAEKLASHQEQVRGELGAGQAAQTSAVSALSEDIMRTVDDRNAGIRELIFQIHELLNAQQEEVTQSTELLSQQIAGVETSIAATDSLLAEQVNEVQQKITALREDVDTKAASEEVEQQISQLRAALSEQINSAQEFVRERCAVHDVEVGRKYADLEHKLATCTSALKVYLTELESKLEIHEGATTTKILDLDQAVSAARQEAQDQALQMEERWTAHGVSLTDSYQAVEAALQGKLADVNQLLQLQEKRLRTAEKSTETRFAEQAKRVEEEVTQLTGRISSLAAALAQEVGGSKESLATLTQQLISMQGQLNDHADEVRTALDTEVAVMRDLVSSEMSDFASSSESVRRLEGWLGNLQHSHDDHLGQFDSSSHAQELCLQKVESAVAALQSTVNSMRSTGTSTDQEQRTVLDRLSAEVASIDSVAKQRLSSLEQRLVRQEALSREKVTEVERRLTHHSEQLAGKLQEYDSILSAHHSRVAALETDHADVTASLQRMSEIEARIAARDAAADAKIEQIEGFIVNQVKAMQSRTLPAPVVRKGADSASAASASTSSARLPTRSAGGASRSVACRLLDTTFEAEGKQQQQKEEEEEEEVQQTGYPNDLSRISRMSISPVRKTAAVARKGDILNELVTLTHADESVLFGSPSAQQQQQQQAYVDDACALEENEEVEEEGDMYSADECEAEGPPAVQHRQQQQSQSLAQSLRQQPQSATMKAKVKGAARPTVKERKGRNSKGSEDSEGEEDVQALSQFNSMIQTVNTDIATLGVHLSAFNPTQGKN